MIKKKEEAEEEEEDGSLVSAAPLRSCAQASSPAGHFGRELGRTPRLHVV